MEFDPASTSPASARTLIGQLYDELKRIASARLRVLPLGQTLGPTALVHEAWLRMDSGTAKAWQGQRHFFGAAARAMHDILVESARRKGRMKRGGGAKRVEDDAALDELVAAEPVEDVPALAEALEKLAASEARKHEIVMLRYFAGLQPREIADLLGVSERTVERDWRFARAWLAEAMARS